MDFAAGADAGASDATNTCHDENWLSGGEECPAFRMRQDEILQKMKKNGKSGFGIGFQPEIRRLDWLPKIFA
jgi:hypothetical protein